MSNLSLATQREVEIVEAMKRLSVADASTLSVFWVDEWPGLLVNNQAASGGTCNADTRPSCIITSSTAAANGSGGHYAAFNPSSSLGGISVTGIPGGTSGEWYIASRFLVTTTVDSFAVLSTFSGNPGAGDSIRLGVIGTTVNANGSDTKYVGHCLANGNPILSTVSIDTGVFHIVRFWRKGGATFLSIDAETPVSGNTYPTALAGMGGTVAANNGHTFNRAIVTDWQFAAYARSTS